MRIISLCRSTFGPLQQLSLHSTTTIINSRRNHQGSFEGYARCQGVKILHYHTDDGILWTEHSKLMLKCRDKHIPIEEWVRITRTVSLKIDLRPAWPRENHALKRQAEVAQRHNREPLAVWFPPLCHSEEAYTSVEWWRNSISKFTWFQSGGTLTHLHLFESPILCEIVLSKGELKPKVTVHMGIYLGSLPRHAWSVHMISSMQTGHISPQFHVHFHYMFETVREIPNIPQSYQQNKTS